MGKFSGLFTLDKFCSIFVATRLSLAISRSHCFKVLVAGATNCSDFLDPSSECLGLYLFGGLRSFGG